MTRSLGTGLLLLWLALLPGRGQAAPNAEAARGMRLLQMQGCVACHSLDGSPSAGPSFAGRFGTLVDVRVGGERRRVPFDRAYLARALSDPNAEIAAGFAPHVMPTFALTTEQTAAIATALSELPAEPESDRGLARLAVWLGSGLLGLLLLYAWRRRPKTRPRS
ncbi:MAG: hypothetical protein QM778_08180 [Myxococcales bacterium]